MKKDTNTSEVLIRGLFSAKESSHFATGNLSKEILTTI